jgi:hypothetical protein
MNNASRTPHKKSQVSDKNSLNIDIASTFSRFGNFMGPFEKSLDSVSAKTLDELITKYTAKSLQLDSVVPEVEELSQSVANTILSMKVEVEDKRQALLQLPEIQERRRILAKSLPSRLPLIKFEPRKQTKPLKSNSLQPQTFVSKPLVANPKMSGTPPASGQDMNYSFHFADLSCLQFVAPSTDESILCSPLAQRMSHELTDEPELKFWDDSQML